MLNDPKLSHDDRPVKDLPDVSTIRLEELKKLTEQIQSKTLSISTLTALICTWVPSKTVRTVWFLKPKVAQIPHH